MGAGASASSQASLFTAEQKAEIKKQVGVSTSKKWQDASDVADLESARKEIARLRGLVANVVLDASTSRAAFGLTFLLRPPTVQSKEKSERQRGWASTCFASRHAIS